MICVLPHCHCACRWFSSTLGATSESFADALERFCAAPPKHLLLTPEAADAAAEVAAALAALNAPAAADGESASSSKKLKKKQARLVEELVDKQLVTAQSKMAQMDAQGAAVVFRGRGLERGFAAFFAGVVGHSMLAAHLQFSVVRCAGCDVSLHAPCCLLCLTWVQTSAGCSSSSS